jgi:uncharacterized protein (UPF0335 family)
MPGRNTADGKRLLEMVEQIEDGAQQIAELKDIEKEIYARAKSEGFNPKAIRHVIKVRKNDRDGKRPMREALQSDIDLYLHACGVEDLPLFRHVEAVMRDPAGGDARDKLIDQLRAIAPQDGEIIVTVSGSSWRIWRGPDGEPHADPHTPAQPGAVH